jgi:peptidoglycan/LPS O-acetylase OafA/YrhL
MGIKDEQQAVTPRFDGVDVLRGFSLLSVVLLHTWIRMHFPGSPVNQVMRGQLAHLLLRNGDNGVTVFFAVSGFLITLTSLRRFGSLRQMQPAKSVASWVCPGLSDTGEGDNSASCVVCRFDVSSELA